eukprot:m.1339665 g.1339665  ORF g.1339665 m.1339665 type:complete len:1546 (-) comp24888_c0_seq3:278-4915(-)
MATLEGWLRKRPPKATLGARRWQKRYFKIVGEYLEYSKANSKGELDRHGAISLRAVEDVYKQIYDKVPSKHDVNCGFNVKTDGRTFDLLAESSQDRERWIIGLKTAIRAVLRSGNSAQTRNSMIGLDRDYEAPEDDDDEIAEYTVDRDSDNISGMLDVGGALPNSYRMTEVFDDASTQSVVEEELPVVHTSNSFSETNDTFQSPSDDESQDIDKAFTMLDALVVDPEIQNGTYDGQHSASRDVDGDDNILVASGIEIDILPTSKTVAKADTVVAIDDRASKTASIYTSAYAASDFSAPLPPAPPMAADFGAGSHDEKNSDPGDNISDDSRHSSRGSRSSELTGGHGSAGGEDGPDGSKTRAESPAGVAAIPSALDQDLDMEYNRASNNQQNVYDTGGRRTSGLHGDGAGNTARVAHGRDVGGNKDTVDRFASFTSSHPLQRQNDSIKLSDTAVAVTLWQGKKKYVLDIPLEKGGTVNDLRRTVAQLNATTTPEMQETLELWEVTSGGMEKKLDDDADPHAVLRARGRLVLLYPDKRLIVLFFPDGDFMLAHIKWNVTAEEICAGINKDLKRKLETIAEPGLFLRKNFKDILFAPDDVPLDALYYPAAENGCRERIPHGMSTKLIIKSKIMTRDTNVHGSTKNPQGYLHKKGDDMRKNWKKRWFELKDTMLRYYESQNNKVFLGEIPVSALVRVIAGQPDKNYEYQFILETNLDRGDYVLAADSEERMNSWMGTLRRAIVEPTLSGWLAKKGSGANGNWRDRWFVLRGLHLVYFETKDHTRQRGTIFLNDMADVSKSVDVETQFVITTTTGQRKGGPKGRGATYELRAGSVVEMEEWIRAIRNSSAGQRHSGSGMLIGDGQRGLQHPAGGMSPDDMPEHSPFVDIDHTDTFGRNEHRADASRDATGNNRDPNGGDFGPRTNRGTGSRGPGSGGRRAPGSFRSDSARDRSNSTVFTPSSRFHPLDRAPEALPDPLFSVTEANPHSTDFAYDDSKPNPYAGKDFTPSADKVDVSPALRDVMSQDDALSTLGFAPSVDLQASLHDTSSLQEKLTPSALEATSTNTDCTVINTDVPEGLLAALQGPVQESSSSGPEPSLDATDTVLEVTSVAMFKALVLGRVVDNEENKGSQGSSTNTTHDRIQLSGVELVLQPNGTWAKKSTSEFHERLHREHLVDKSFECFELPGDIMCTYVFEDARWNVVGRKPLHLRHMSNVSESTAGMPLQHKPDAVVGQWASIHGIQPIVRAQAIVEQILATYNEPLQGIVGASSSSSDNEREALRLALEKTRRLLLDDSRNDSIGIIVRKSLCGSIADVLRHRMRESRLGGLVKNTLWSLIQHATPRPSASSEPFEMTAYRVIKDLEKNPNMANDADIKFRSFVCAGLNHHFLCAWLDKLYHNQAVVTKFYPSNAFMMVCPEQVYSQFVLALEPLMALPFRLFTSFEIRRRSTVRRRPRPSVAVAVAPVRSASMYLEGSRPPPASRPGDHRAEPKQPVAVALYDNMQPETAEELAFAAGDTLFVVGQEDENWLLCDLGAMRGLVPMNYVEIQS